MAFDAGPRFDRTPPPPARRSAEDVLDIALRGVVLIPLLGLYSWWIASIVWKGVTLLLE